MNAPIQIRRHDVVEKIRRLSQIQGLPITDVVARLVDAELLKSDDDLERRQAQVEKIVTRFNALPKVGPRLTDDDLYGEHGLPK
jgi:hypothetical protein